MQQVQWVVELTVYFQFSKLGGGGRGLSKQTRTPRWAKNGGKSPTPLPLLLYIFHTCDRS